MSDAPRRDYCPHGLPTRHDGRGAGCPVCPGREPEPLLDDTHIVATVAYLDALPRYDSSRPTGLYVGKRWASGPRDPVTTVWAVEPDPRDRPDMVLIHPRRALPV